MRAGEEALSTVLHTCASFQSFACCGDTHAGHVIHSLWTYRRLTMALGGRHCRSANITTAMSLATNVHQSVSICTLRKCHKAPSACSLKYDRNIRVQGFDVDFDDARAFAAQCRLHSACTFKHKSRNSLIAMAIYRFYTLNFTGCTL